MNRIIFCTLYPIDWIHTSIILPILIFSGAFGNVVTMKIFFQMKMKTSTFPIYFLTLAINDLFHLISFAIPNWINYGVNRFGKILPEPQNLSIYSCVGLNYVWNFSWFISSWILMAYSIERVLAISFPFMRTQYITVATAKKVCCVISLVGILIFSLVLYGSIYEMKTKNSQEKVCGYSEYKTNAIMLLIYILMIMFLLVFIPPVSIAIINIILLIKVIKVLRKRSQVMHRDSVSINEIKKAKDLLWLSLFMVFFTFPVLSWIYVYIAKCMHFSIVFIFELLKVCKCIQR